jgi:hypothetical protein
MRKPFVFGLAMVLAVPIVNAQQPPSGNAKTQPKAFKVQAKGTMVYRSRMSRRFVAGTKLDPRVAAELHELMQGRLSQHTDAIGFTRPKP